MYDGLIDGEERNLKNRYPDAKYKMIYGGCSPPKMRQGG
jgi:hypothetical protein